MRWMNLEPIIQSEVSQKEKDKYHILMHIYGIQKIGTEEFTYRAAMEKQREQTYGYGERGGEGELYGKSNMEIYITICKIDSQFICCMAQETQVGVLYQSTWVGWGGR